MLWAMARPPDAGSPAPDFELPATGRDAVVRLSALAPQRVVLYFYPKDHTPGCTAEGRDFRDLHTRFRRRQARIFGVSRDSLRTHENFKAKQGFPFELLSDADEVVCRLYDVIKMKNMYGRQVRGIERSTFLIDERGVIRRVWRKVRVPGHAEEVLQALAELPRP